MKNKKRNATILLLILSMMLNIGCGNAKDYNDGKNYHSIKNKKESEKQAEITNSYDSTMTAAIKSVNQDVGIVIVIDTDTGVEYTMTYGENLQVIDRYGDDKTISYLSDGDVVQAYYLKNSVKLTAVLYSPDIWECKESDNWQIDTQKASITINWLKYYYNPQDLIVLSEGETIELQDLTKQDVISVRGMDKKALVISVDRGHGYVKLDGIQRFIGGWVQIDKIIKPITENMLLVAPEGTYDVKIVKDGYGGALSATIERNKEITIDFTDVSSRIVQYGTVEFSIRPKEAQAKLYIAGQEINYNSPTLLEYDSYKLQVKAEGYKTYSATLKVAQNLQQIDIELEKEDNGTESPKPTSTPSHSQTPADTSQPQASQPPQTSATENPGTSVIVTQTETPATVGSYSIIISDPEGVNVYFDDEYKGIAPVSFPKVSGSHTLTLSKDGCETKSYTLEINDADDNVTYCMPALAQNAG